MNGTVTTASTILRRSILVIVWPVVALGFLLIFLGLGILEVTGWTNRE